MPYGFPQESCDKTDTFNTSKVTAPGFESQRKQVHECREIGTVFQVIRNIAMPRSF